MTLLLLMAALLQQSPVLRDVEQRLGPFRIDGHSFLVVLYKKRLPNHSETTFALEIHNEADDIEYARTFPYEVRDGKFRETMSVSAKLVRGSLRIQYTKQPTQIFRLKDGKLIPDE